MEDDRGAYGGREKGGDRSRGRGGRRRDRGYRDRGQRGKVDGISQQQPPMKTPIILTKTATERGQESPVKHILLKPRDSPSDEGGRTVTDGASLSTVLPTVVSKTPKAEEEHPPQGADAGSVGGIVSGPGTISIQRSSSALTVTPSTGVTEGITSGLAALKLNTMDREPSQCIRLLDENLHWTDAALELLADQSDFLVIGAIGLQGAGKSTILSMLAGATPTTEPRSYLFSPQSKQTQETGSNQTSGVNIGITTERVILLDTQPVLSPSMLDHLIHHDRSIPSDFSSPENYNEMQSLQIVTFLLTVCHVILVVQDWFTDVNLLRLLRSAEMLKPSSVPHTSSHDSSGNSSSQDNMEDHYPDVVFVYNKATREDYHPENIQAMHAVTSAIIQHSRLRFLSGISLLGSSLLSYSQILTSCEDVNVHLVPAYEARTTGHHRGNGVIPAYRGYPSFEMVLETLRNQDLFPAAVGQSPSYFCAKHPVPVTLAEKFVECPLMSLFRSFTVLNTHKLITDGHGQDFCFLYFVVQDLLPGIIFDNWKSKTVLSLNCEIGNLVICMQYEIMASFYYNLQQLSIDLSQLSSS